MTIKFPNYYSNTTKAIFEDKWDKLEGTFIYSTCLVDAYEDYSCFGEVSFFVVLMVS
jgi:hypothetical protein